jgi:hypothetical protein
MKSRGRTEEDGFFLSANDPEFSLIVEDVMQLVKDNPTLAPQAMAEGFFDNSKLGAMAQKSLSQFPTIQNMIGSQAYGPTSSDSGSGYSAGGTP